MSGTGTFGVSVAAVDIDADGRAEVFVGASTYSSPGLTADGALYVIPGQDDFENAPQPSAPWITGNVTNRYLGRSVASAGDVNDDGYDDLIIGANRTVNGSSGSVYLYLGSVSGLTTALSSDVYPATAASLPAYAPHWYVLNFGDWFGVSVAPAGDIDGDGYADIAVGGPRGQKAYVYYGKDLRSGTTGTFTTITGPSARYGWSVAGAGDINQDGCDDLLVGEALGGGTASQGYVSLFYGGDGGVNCQGSDVGIASKSWTLADWVANATPTDTYFSTGLLGLGDFDGDGYPDIAVGASRSDFGATNGGSLLVYLGSETGLPTADCGSGSCGIVPEPSWAYHGATASRYIGYSLAKGDLNGDGIPDVAAGTEAGGRAYIFYGNTIAVATADAISVAEGGTATTLVGGATSVLDNDSDEDAQTLSAVLETGPTHAASFTLNADGTFSYTHDGSETTSDSFTYVVHDGVADSNAVEVTITVTPVDDAPTITSSAGSAATEDSLYTYAASASDPEATQLTWSLHEDDTCGGSIDSSGVYTFTPSGPVPAASCVVAITVCDAGSACDSDSAVVSITSVNDAPAITSSAGTAATEDSLYTYAASASDPEGTQLTWSLHEDDTCGGSIDSDGVYMFTPTGPVPASSCVVAITVCDAGSACDSDSAVVSITSVNDAPAITSSAGTAATEDSLYTYAASASDPEGTQLTWSLHEDDTCGGSINSSGVYTFTPSGPVPPASCVVAITVCDAGSACDSDSAVVSITSVNDAPAITSSAGTAATEDSLYTYAASASDPEGTQLTWSLHEDDTCGGSIDSDGVYMFTPTGPVPASSCVVAITVCDAGSACDSDSAVVSITSVNDAPVITSSAGSTATEDSVYTYAASASDPEGTQLTWSIHEDDTCGGSINSSGVYTFTPSGPVPPASCVVAITVCDAGSACDSDSAVVSITSVNDAPAITSSAGTAATEDSLYTYAASASDPEGTQLTWSLHEDDTCGGSIDSGGVYTFTPSGPVPAASCVVAITVCDAGNACDSDSAVVSITSVNDAPAITSSAGTAATEGTLYGYSATATDPENDVLTWMVGEDDTCGGSVDSNGVYTFTPAGPVPPASCVVAIMACDPEACDEQAATVTITAVNDALEITSTAGTSAVEDILYTYEAAAFDPESDPITWSVHESDTCGGMIDEDGVYSFTPNGPSPPASCLLAITACDLESCYSQTATVSITSVNDAPAITSSAGAAATEDSLYTYAAAASDPEGTQLTWLVHQDDTCGGSVDSSGVYTFTPAGPLPAASCVVAIRVCDAADVCDSDSAVVNITSVNDGPVITSSAGAAAMEGILYTYAAAASDPEGTQLTWSIHQDDTCGGSVDSSGVYTFTPAGPLPAASCVVAIRVCDAADACDIDSAVVSITSVNDGPAITSSAGAAATEGILYTYAAAASDPEGTQLTWLVHQDDTCGGSIDSSGVYTFAPAGPVPPASCVVAITVCDAGNACDIDSAVVSITAVNQPPMVTSAAPSTVVEGSLYTFQPTATDPDSALLTWSLHEDDTCGGAMSVTGIYSFTPTAPGTCTVAITVCDSDQLCDTVTAVVSIAAAPEEEPEQPGEEPEQPGEEPEQPGEEPEQPGEQPQQPEEPQQPEARPRVISDKDGCAMSASTSSKPLSLYGLLVLGVFLARRRRATAAAAE